MKNDTAINGASDFTLQTEYSAERKNIDSDIPLTMKCGKE